MKKQELFEEIKKLNERLDKIEKQLEKQEEETRAQKNQEWLDKFGDFYGTAIEGTIPDPCKGCSNHPSNGGSGICHCTIPYLSGTSGVTYDVRR